MMGRSHSKQGVCVAIALGALATVVKFLPTDRPADIALTALVLISGSTFPDIDASGSNATKSFGLITKALHKIIAAITQVVYKLTRGPGDPVLKGSHRLLTHTLIGNLGAGAALTGLCSLGQIPAAIAMGLLVGMATAVFWRQAKWLVAFAAGLSVYLLPAPEPWLWGVAFAIGNMVHCFGDSCTVSGTPWFWPIGKGKKRWHNFHVLPESMRFTTGKEQEQIALYTTYIATAASIVIGGVITWYLTSGA